MQEETHLAQAEQQHQHRQYPDRKVDPGEDSINRQRDKPLDGCEPCRKLRHYGVGLA